MKKNKLGKVLAIGAAAYAIKALADKNKEETALNNIFAGLKQNAQTDTSEIPFSPEEFKKWLDANPAIKAALKGAAGEAGADGSNGVDGNQILNFGGSLVNSISGQTETLPSGLVASGDFLNGVKVLTINSAFQVVVNNINFKKIYALDFFVKSTSNELIYIFSKDNDGNTINAFNGSNEVSVQTGINGSFVAKRLYFSFPIITLPIGFVNLYFNKSGSEFKINSATFKEVTLGEAVPSNLPYLPTGQEVYDTTTGDRGRYNGTAVDWYTMV